VREKQRRLAEYSELLDHVQVKSSPESCEVLEALGTSPLDQSQSAARVLRRPEVTFQHLLDILSPEDRERLATAPPETVEQLEIEAMYEGYLKRQLAEVSRQRATETMIIPARYDYSGLLGLTFEAKDKLGRMRPATVGQASRVPGVSPADISVLLIHLQRAMAARDARAPAAAEVAADQAAVSEAAESAAPAGAGVIDCD
jgi:tRNA uridine 5-carboxymethylaminomethyl modification enzyme